MGIIAFFKTKFLKMKNNLILVLVLAVFLSSCNTDPGDPSPSLTKYKDIYWNTVTVDSNIVFGSSTSMGGTTQDLLMDYYQGSEDSKNPTLIFAHGGGYTDGDKSQLSEMCIELAKYGYNVASVSYRLIDVMPDSTTFTRAVIDGIFDMKAAVRFLRKNHDMYEVDTNNIFIGGYSAGAFTAIHYAYLDDMNEVEAIGGPIFVNYINANGGLEGNSGNAGYSSDFKGVLNISGAIANPLLINSGDEIIFSAHGTADQVVPYGEGQSNNTGITTYGSSIIHQTTAVHNIKNQLRTIQDGDHGAFFNDCDDCIQLMTSFIYDNL